MGNNRQTILLLVSFILAVNATTRIKHSAQNAILIDSYLYEKSFEMPKQQRPTYEQYNEERQEVFANENRRWLGSSISLTSAEEAANNVIMRYKVEDYAAGIENPHSFNPSRHIFEVLQSINSSELFHIIRKMPKGAILHAHDTALVSTDFLVSVTYRDNLWQCNNTETNQPLYKFALEQPTPIDNHCDWVTVASERNRLGDEEYDHQVRSLFTLYTENPLIEFKDINDVWSRFMNIFTVVESLVTYVDVWNDYFRQSLKEFLEDGVQYLEFRGLLPPVYDLDGKIYSKSEIVGMYKTVSDQFVLENPTFIGSKFIYAPIKHVTDEVFDEYLVTLQALLEEFPDYVAGFDLVGQEDTGRPLKEFAEKLLQLPENVRFFFHAGETNWYGTTSDENLIDAVLLGTERIGHGFALVKHPRLMELIKERNITVEVNPISNQVLKLVEDYRNHPCAVFFSDDYKTVISSDDPSFWEATPLSHDFYQAFLGIAAKNHDLRLLKQLAINSLEASAMTESEKARAFTLWTAEWDKFIQIINNNQTKK